MGILDGLGSSALSLGGGAFSGMQSARYAKSARAWQKRRYAERYQVTVKDLRKSGLNPILAAQGALGGVGAGMSGASAQMPNLSGIGDTMTNARKAPAEMAERRQKARQSTVQSKLLNEQILTTRSMTALNEAKAIESTANARNMQNQTDRWAVVGDIGKIISDMVTGPAATGAKDFAITPTNARELYAFLKKSGVMQDTWEQAKEDMTALWEYFRNNSADRLIRKGVSDR